MVKLRCLIYFIGVAHYVIFTAIPIVIVLLLKQTTRVFIVVIIRKHDSAIFLLLVHYCIILRSSVLAIVALCTTREDNDRNGLCLLVLGRLLQLLLLKIGSLKSDSGVSLRSNVQDSIAPLCLMLVCHIWHDRRTRCVALVVDFE